MAILEARDVSFEYESHDFGLKGVNVEVRSGRSLALVGFNAQGKSTLCRLLGQVSLPQTPARGPRSGRVFYSPRGSYERIEPYATTWLSSCFVWLLVVGALALAVGRSALAAAPFVYAVERARRRWRQAWYAARVVYVTTEHDMAKRQLRDGWSLTDGITGHLKWALTKREREGLAERLLTWAGFRRFGEDGRELNEVDTFSATCGELSGGQRQLVYLLRGLAPVFAPQRRLLPRVDVLILDEAFNCFDADIRPRALRLARRTLDYGVGVVVVNQVLHEVAVLCDDAVFVHDGVVVDAAPVADMLKEDRKDAHPECKRYVQATWELERDMRQAAGKEDDVASSCGAALAATIATLPDLYFVGPPWDSRDLQRGDKVTIIGLAAQRRFNGKTALVLGRLDPRGFRFKVKLKDSQTLAVKRANLQLLDASGTPPPSLVSRLTAALVGGLVVQKEKAA